MELPPAVDVDFDALRARHGLDGAIEPLRDAGIFNTAYAVGADLVLRVPRNDPFFIETARKELVAVPAARAAGVRTPAIVVADLSCELVPVPYAIYERAEGDNLERVAADPAAESAVWRELGSDLALLHGRVETSDALAGLRCEELPDAGALLDDAATRGFISSVEERWLSAWLDSLAPAQAEADMRFVHGDIQGANVMAIRTGTTHTYTALLDWGGCGWADPANDFAGVPLRAVPAMLVGYRDGGEAGDGLKARIVWRQLQLALFNLRRGPEPDRSWAERPAAMMLDVLRFFVDAPRGWRAVGPPVRRPA